MERQLNRREQDILALERRGFPAAAKERAVRNWAPPRSRCSSTRGPWRTTR
ncbi:hypothetical protein SGLAM104S_07805 [Streptomyces glaucescens]